MEMKDVHIGSVFIRLISFVTSCQLTSLIKMPHSAGHPQQWNSGSSDKLYLSNKIKTLNVVGSKIFRPDQLFKVTEIKQICYFST